MSGEIDKMYQDKMWEELNSVTVNEQVQVSFLNGPHIAQTLLGLIEEPTTFLQAQNELIYGSERQALRPNILEENTFQQAAVENGLLVQKRKQEGGTIFLDLERINDAPYEVEVVTTNGLPSNVSIHASATMSEERFHQSDSKKKGRILNIGSGSDPQKQLAGVINVDISDVGRPDVVADAKRLPFATGSMTLVMASHVLEHIPQVSTGNQIGITETIQEWDRVMHKKGLLRIAVPDAKTTLEALKNGNTPTGKPSYNAEGGSAPLTQVVGLGGENSQTDDRWRHTILFSEALLSLFLSEAGLPKQRKYKSEEALSQLMGINLDETNRWSLEVQSEHERQPHITKAPPTAQEYKALVREFLKKEQKDKLQPLSIIVPIHNEQERLRIFLPMLFSSLSMTELDLDTELIFVFSDCNDASEKIVNEYVDLLGEGHQVQTLKSPKGILPTFLKGIDARKKKGYIAKIDADTILNPTSLGLMFMFMSENPEVKATYAESQPIEELNLVNIAEHNQYFRTERNYIHGRQSMYRANPFEGFNIDKMVATGALTEDVILSLFFVYYHGIDSIKATPGAVVKTESLTDTDKLIKQRERARREIKLIMHSFPQFEVLKDIMTRRTSSFDQIVHLNGDSSELHLMLDYYRALNDLAQHLARKNVSSNVASESHREWGVR